MKWEPTSIKKDKGQEGILQKTQSVPAAMQSPNSDESRADMMGFQDPEAQEAYAFLGLNHGKKQGLR